MLFSLGYCCLLREVVHRECQTWNPTLSLMDLRVSVICSLFAGTNE